jgi:hypothetical protein
MAGRVFLIAQDQTAWSAPLYYWRLQQRPAGRNFIDDGRIAAGRLRYSGERPCFELGNIL